MWTEQPIERLLKGRLATEYGTTGDTYWSNYVKTRDDIEQQILPWIARNEPDLTDHGIDHIANVMTNVGLILGQPAGNIQAETNAAINGLSSKELLLLLLGCLLHDVGNISGRKNHNVTGLDVWRQAGGSYDMWKKNDRRTIIDVCRAHTGTTEDGKTDTLHPLSTSIKYFLQDRIRAAEMAAILRLADELAEGPQRTSQYMRKQKQFSSGSELYHLYATCTHVTIDSVGARIALSYDIDLDDPILGDGKTGKIEFKRFLELVYDRILKLELERVFARHYAPALIPFRETSVSIHFSRSKPELSNSLPPLILNDFNSKSPSHKVFSKLNSAYDLDDIVNSLYPDGGASGRN